MSRYDDDYRGRPRHDHDGSPDYTYAGGTGHAPSQTSFPGATSQARLAYEPQTPFYPPPPNQQGGLQVPDGRGRPRSLPPPVGWRGSRRSRHDDDDYSDDDYDSGDDHNRRARSKTPIAKARKALGNTFTDSTTGLGVGVLGALVGGLAAREAAEASSKGNHGRRHHEQQKRTELLSTVVGAAVGALGANAIEKRIEVNREKGRREEREWEDKWRPGSSGGTRSRGRRSDPDLVERREVYATGRGNGWKKDWEWERDRVRDRDTDPDARSWRDVEDWVYDERGDKERRRSGEKGRY